MLLRSSSTPMLNSWLPTGSGYGSSPEPETLTRVRSFTLAMSEDGLGRRNQSRSAIDSEPKRNPRLPSIRLPARMKDRREPQETMSILLSDRRRPEPQTVVSGGGVIGGGFGGVCGGGRGSDYGSDPGRWNGRESTDAYYETMIEANPGNPLLLANYAKFLKDVNC